MPRTALVHAARIAGLVLSLGTGCNDHFPGNYDDGPQITDRGISVPVPPPSLKLAPVQDVDIEGEIGVSNADMKVWVTITDHRANSDVQPDSGVQPAEADGSFRFTGFNLDLTDNCLEVFTDKPGVPDSMSVTSFFRARIDEDDQSIITEQIFSGCP